MNYWSKWSLMFLGFSMCNLAFQGNASWPVQVVALAIASSCFTVLLASQEL